MTRVLIERLIVNKPHPWGLLNTFYELIRNPVSSNRASWARILFVGCAGCKHEKHAAQAVHSWVADQQRTLCAAVLCFACVRATGSGGQGV
jgi:hypothetical protein